MAALAAVMEAVRGEPPGRFNHQLLRRALAAALRSPADSDAATAAAVAPAADSGAPGEEAGANLTAGAAAPAGPTGELLGVLVYKYMPFADVRSAC